MSLFKKLNDLFKNSENKSAANEGYSTKLYKVNKGGPGDAWKGFIGLNEDSDNKIIIHNLVLHTLSNGLKEKNTNNNCEISRIVLENFEIVVLHKDVVISTFPILKTKNHIEFNLSEIYEWEHVGGIEAVAAGGAKGMYAIKFYISDYLKNKDIYLKQADLRVYISAFALTVEKETPVSNKTDDFTGYMPYNNLPESTLIKYFGIITELKNINETINSVNIKGLVAKLRVANSTEANMDFLIDIYISDNNLNVSIKEGDSISGVLWLQAQLAEDNNK